MFQGRFSLNAVKIRVFHNMTSYQLGKSARFQRSSDSEVGGSVVSREGRIMDIALLVGVGFEPWVKDGELWTAHLVE